MNTKPCFDTQLLLGLAAFVLGCGGTMNTGTAKRPVNNKPAADGTCPSAQSLCGTGVFAVCVDLQNDPAYCGTCDRACSPGIACQAGVCQQTVCTGTTVPLSGQPTTSTSTTGGTSTTDGGATTGDASITGPAPYFFSANQILADVNGDGRLDLIEDLAFWNSCQNCGVDLTEFHVSLGLTGGGFAPPDTYHASADIEEIFATDVNSDGMADLYVVSSTYSNSSIAPYHVELWLGQKDGHLKRSDAAGLSVDAMSGSGYQIAIGDLSGDGWPDLVMSTPDSDLEAPPKINVYLSDNTGALRLSQTFFAWAGRTFIRDWNRDGSPDLVLLWGSVEILYNRGDGTFEQPVNCGLSVGYGSWGQRDVVVEDFNRDGWMDLAVGDGYMDNRVDVMLGLGGCGFAPISFYDVPGSSVEFLGAADMNGDGILDLVSVGPVSGPDPNDPNGLATVTTDNLLAVLIGKPDGTFQLQDTVISLGPNQISDVAIGEVSGDQRPDIVVSSAGGRTGQTSIWENTCQ